MRAMQRPGWAVLGLTLSCLPALAQTPPPAPSAPPPAPTAPAAAPNAVAATVNGQPILESAVQRGLHRVPPQKHTEARPQVLHYLIDLALLDQYLLQLHVAVDPKEVEKSVAEMKAELQKRNQDFAKMLAELRLTEAELNEQIAAEMRWSKFAEERADRQGAQGTLRLAKVSI